MHYGEARGLGFNRLNRRANELARRFLRVMINGWVYCSLTTKHWAHNNSQPPELGWIGPDVYLIYLLDFNFTAHPSILTKCPPAENPGGDAFGINTVFLCVCVTSVLPFAVMYL